MSKYDDWICLNYPTSYSATNKCKEASYSMSIKFSELKVIKGFIAVSGVGPNIEHWWCRGTDGVVIDPTGHQWEGIILSYKEFEGEEPVAKCYQCGEYVYPSKSKNLIFCHKHDHLDINKLLSE